MLEKSVYKSAIEFELLEKLEPVLENLGFECRDVEVFSSGSGIIRVTVDRPGGPDRVHISIDDCSKVHQVIGPMFDVWDPLPTAYTLEVSSPGEQPHLRKLSHFTEAIGEKIKFQSLEAVVMPSPAKPRKNWEGILSEVDPESGELTLKDHDGSEHRIAVGQIKSAVWLRVWKA